MSVDNLTSFSLKNPAAVWGKAWKIRRAVHDLTLSLHKSRVLNAKEEVTNSLASGILILPLLLASLRLVLLSRNNAWAMVFRE